jgi:hypothetical protein
MPEDKGDALDVLVQEDRVVGDLLDAWKSDTARLEEADDIEVRSERGANVKLLTQHLALREGAITEVVAALPEGGEDASADSLEADGVRRREAIGELEQQARGLQAMSLNTADVSRAVLAVAEVIDAEMATRRDLIAHVAGTLGPPEERELRSARYVRTHSPTAPSPEERWHDRVGPLKAVRTAYGHLRGTPRGGTEPSVDPTREKDDVKDGRRTR